MKAVCLIIFIITVVCLPMPAYSTWEDYKDVGGVNIDGDFKVGHIDIDGDFVHEIIIEKRYGAGSGHYIEMIRIFKEDNESAGLKLIFMVTTLDRIFGYGPSNDDISVVEFTEPNIKTGFRDIIVKSKRVYYKDEQNKIIDREKDKGIKIFKWNGEKFIEEKEAGQGVTNGKK